MARKQPITETVTRNGRTFPRYLTSPTAGGWHVADLSTNVLLPDRFPNKRTALAAAKRLNRGGSL